MPCIFANTAQRIRAADSQYALKSKYQMDDCQSPIFLDFKKSRYLAAADVSNATLMLTKSIYSVLLIYSIRPATIRDHNIGSRGGLLPLSFK
jgi:hypothetical protein